ncbi:MAG: hypothetical protein AB8G14_11295 [Ilumatobacter sp.]
MRFGLDSTWHRAGSDGRAVLAGSPLRMFRLTSAGADVVDCIERGEHVESTLIDRLVDAGAIHPVAEHPAAFTAADITIVTPQLGGSVVSDGRITIDDSSIPPLAGATERLGVNRGPAAARNAGRRHVNTPLVAFFDADVDQRFDDLTTDAAAEWWAPLLAHFDDPNVGLVAPRVLGDATSSLDLGAEPGRVSAGTRVSYVPAAAILVRVAAFDDVGGFDEQLRFGEDVDFVWRLADARWRCRYEPSVTVTHHPRATLRARLSQQVGYGSSSAPLAMRHPSALAPMRTSIWTAGVWGLVALGQPVAAVGLASANAALVARTLPDVAASTIARIAVRSQLRAGLQTAEATRRVWWPFVALVALVSRRARWVAIAAIAARPRRTLLDLAFGWGVWGGVIKHRTLGPILPRIVSTRSG